VGTRTSSRHQSPLQALPYPGRERERISTSGGNARLVLLLLSIVWLAAAVWPWPVQANPTLSVLTNESVVDSELSSRTLRLFFSMRVAEWSDGQNTRVFVLPDDHPAHVTLCRQILKRFPYQLRRDWDRQVFSGTGQAPIEVGSVEEMLQRLAETPGAVGYIGAQNGDIPLPEKVKILEIGK